MDKNLLSAISIPELKLRISIGEKNLGKVKNKTTTWAKLISKMSEPLVDVQHTLPQYLNLSKERQAELKNVGFFVGGHCDGGVRRIGSIQERWVVTLDVDECTMAHVFDLKSGASELSEYEFFVYSTRKHTPEKPRLRIILPLEKPCEAEAYHALSRILAEKFDVTMESIDPVSYRITQLMYWPSVCKEADFLTFRNSGRLIVPEVNVTTVTTMLPAKNLKTRKRKRG
jgi:putative DNA primase/helicase